MQYDPLNPIVYFDIGEAVAAIAILLAFISVATPTHKFRWALGWFRLRTAYFLFFLGLLFVLIAAALPVIPVTLPHITAYPIFWEMTAGFMFIFGSFGLLVCGARPVRFSRKNYNRFFRLCYSVIGRGGEKEMAALAFTD